MFDLRWISLDRITYRRSHYGEDCIDNTQEIAIYVLQSSGISWKSGALTTARYSQKEN